jgi:ribosomal protein S18 acetylase RimI-like enzyme
MQIRRLVEGDEAAACQLIEQVKFTIDEVADVSLDPVDMAALVSDERAYLIAAYVDDRPVGLVYGYRFPRLDGPRPMMFLYEAGVLAQHRRRGIGRALAEELKRFARESNCRKMFVPTEASNEAAMALYRSAGGEGGADKDAAAFWWNW